MMCGFGAYPVCGPSEGGPVCSLLLVNVHSQWRPGTIN